MGRKQFLQYHENTFLTNLHDVHTYINIHFYIPHVSMFYEK